MKQKDRLKRKRSQRQPKASGQTKVGSQPGDTRHLDILCWIVLLAGGVLLYGHTLDAPWYLDDFPNIVQTIIVHDLSLALENFFNQRGPAYLSFALNYRVGGLSLPGFHIINILIHVLTSCLVFLVAKRVFHQNRLYAFLVAAIFLVHPLQTQAITYIVQRMASMASLFGFLSLYLYIRARERLDEGVRWLDAKHLCFWFTALASCYLAVKTKENLAILPFAIILFDYFYLSLRKEKNWSLKFYTVYIVPFFLPSLSAAYHQLATPLVKGETLKMVASVHEAGITPIQYLVTEFKVIWIYLKLLIFPYPQMLDYVYPVTRTFIPFQNLLGLTGLIILLSAGFIFRKRFAHLSFGIFWFLLCLSVESTLIPLDPVNEHRLYLSMFGFAVFCVGAGHYFLTRKIFVPIVFCCLFVLCCLTWSRNQMWNDELAMYQDNAKHIVPDDGFNLALSKAMLMRKLYPEAIDVLNQTVESGTKNIGIFLNQAVAYRLNNQPGEAIKGINNATDEGIQNVNINIELARSYSQIYNYDKAIEVYRNVLLNKQRTDLVNKELGLMLARMKRFVEAEPYLQHTLKTNPDSMILRYYIAEANIEKGNINTAIRLLREVVIADPTMKPAWYSLGLIGNDIGNEKLFSKALEQLYRLDPVEAERLKESTLLKE